MGGGCACVVNKSEEEIKNSYSENSQKNSKNSLI